MITAAEPRTAFETATSCELPAPRLPDERVYHAGPAYMVGPIGCGRLQSRPREECVAKKSLTELAGSVGSDLLAVFGIPAATLQTALGQHLARRLSYPGRLCGPWRSEFVPPWE